ncbi:hypothetical protein BHC47_09770 [Snodgrassella alvi]|uniref:Prepilin-type N-terminal cleavage/methylation domain-containing protein n=1 Tax=Snodgrassella alvi TaxID=1196083 RepID=A0A2N9Y6F9_9NEIS|nr:PilX family type IV pilin [Snodgrassella alvi]PIT64153.1 hypothetical protein BHC56_05260 [Snodgrassella alvi]PIT64454.1 hypothetical protein BHC47_09770 [Snodgrassella alvi]
MSNKFLNKGFSLLEMMIVVSIIGILSAIAVPIYRNYVEKANVTDAKTTLLTINQRVAERKLQLLNGNLVLNDISTIISQETNSNSNVSKKYTIAAQCIDTNCLNYRIYAVPISGNGLKKSAWLGSNAGLYICNLTEGVDGIDASKNANCDKQ